MPLMVRWEADMPLNPVLHQQVSPQAFLAHPMAVQPLQTHSQRSTDPHVLLPVLPKGAAFPTAIRQHLLMKSCSRMPTHLRLWTTATQP